MPYIKKTTKSGKLLGVEIYFALRKGRGYTRSKWAQEQTETQALQNERRARKQLQRLILTNFTRNDLFLTFTHRAELTEQQAKREERNLLDRVKRMYAKKGLVPPKYIIVTEKQGRWHHHLILSGGVDLAEARARFKAVLQMNAI